MLCENSQKEVVISKKAIPRVTIEDEELEFILLGLDSLYEQKYLNGDDRKAHRVLEFKNKLLKAQKEDTSPREKEPYKKCKVCDD